MKHQKKLQIKMKGHPVLTERWLQDEIAADPGLLGLGGDLRLAGQGKRVSSGGRLDLLLIDDEEDVRYEAELQLGATDASHIIRTLEYWDLEKRQYPDSRHVAVIVAEDITARFFNVISLFGRFIPIVAIKVCAIDLGDGNVAMVFVPVLDHRVRDTGVDEPAIAKDREFWEKKSKSEYIALMDQMLLMLHKIDRSIELNYNQQYVGLISDHRSKTYVVFKPKKTQLNVEIKLPKEDTYGAMLDDSGIVQNKYNATYKQYQLVIQPGISESDLQLLQKLFKAAYDQSKED